MKKILITILLLYLNVCLLGCVENNKKINNENALSAIKNYCYINYPDLKDMEESDDFTTYFEVEKDENEEIVVLFRSYTGAQVRYYIDVESGETYVTEFVPYITEKEEKTDETFNIRDYIN